MIKEFLDRYEQGHRADGWVGRVLSGRTDHRPPSWGWGKQPLSQAPWLIGPTWGERRGWGLVGGGGGQDQDGPRPSLLDPIRLTEDEDLGWRKPPLGI